MPMRKQVAGVSKSFIRLESADGVQRLEALFPPISSRIIEVLIDSAIPDLALEIAYIPKVSISTRQGVEVTKTKTTHQLSYFLSGRVVARMCWFTITH
jgi:hypothetical protein